MKIYRDLWKRRLEKARQSPKKLIIFEIDSVQIQFGFSTYLKF